MTGFIDIHAHVLPGVDDGAENWEESRRMLEVAYGQGIRHIIATPHYSGRRKSGGLPELAEQLQQKAYEIAPDFHISLGQEIYYHEGMVDNLKEGKALTLAGSSYVLVEFETQVSWNLIYQAVRKLVQARYIPVVAHAERYAVLREHGKLEELSGAGARLQMNYSSLKNRPFDADVRWCRRQVLEGRIQFLATDMHHASGHRKPDTASSEWLMKKGGRNLLRRLTVKNPAEILKDKSNQ